MTTPIDNTPLAASDFEETRVLPLHADLHDRGFVGSSVMMAMREDQSKRPYQAASPMITHPRVPGLCVASPSVGWFSVTHERTGRAIGTNCSTDHVREVVTMLRYGVLARHCGFSFDGIDGPAMREQLAAHRDDVLPFVVDGCRTIDEYREASRIADFLDLQPGSMGDVDTLLDLLAPETPQPNGVS